MWCVCVLPIYGSAELTGRSDVDCSRPQTWSIDNKYYQTEVAIEVHDEGGGGGGGQMVCGEGGGACGVGDRALEQPGGGGGGGGGRCVVDS